MSKLDTAIGFCGLYEAELLVSLMLRYWEHPCADDDELVNYLVESSAEILKRSQRGEKFLEDIPPTDMNFVAAVWYAEFCQVQDSEESNLKQRQNWLTTVHRSIPSCFCDPNDLMS